MGTFHGSSLPRPESFCMVVQTAIFASVTEMLYKTSLHQRRSALWNGTSLREMIHDWKPQRVPLMDPREGISLINSFM